MLRKLDWLIAGKGGSAGQVKHKNAASAFCRYSVLGRQVSRSQQDFGLNLGREVYGDRICSYVS